VEREENKNVCMCAKRNKIENCDKQIAFNLLFIQRQPKKKEAINYFQWLIIIMESGTD
jgi:hypothetical protein